MSSRVFSSVGRPLFGGSTGLLSGLPAGLLSGGGGRDSSDRASPSVGSDLCPLWSGLLSGGSSGSFDGSSGAPPPGHIKRSTSRSFVRGGPISTIEASIVLVKGPPSAAPRSHHRENRPGKTPDKTRTELSRTKPGQNPDKSRMESAAPRLVHGGHVGPRSESGYELVTSGLSAVPQLGGRG